MATSSGVVDLTGPRALLARGLLRWREAGALLALVSNNDEDTVRAVLDRPECNAVALKVLARIWAVAWDDRTGIGHVLGRAEPRGMLDDNVQCAAAFLDAFEATGDVAWRDRAGKIMDYCVAQHGDGSEGGFLDLAAGRGGAAYLTTRAKPVQDAPSPSPNGVAAVVLARLSALTDAPVWRERLIATLPHRRPPPLRPRARWRAECSAPRPSCRPAARARRPRKPGRARPESARPCRAWI